MVFPVSTSCQVPAMGPDPVPGGTKLTEGELKRLPMRIAMTSIFNYIFTMARRPLH